MHPLGYQDTQVPNSPLNKYNNPPLRSCFYWHLVRGNGDTCVHSTWHRRRTRRRPSSTCKTTTVRVQVSWFPSPMHTGYRRATVVPDWLRPRWAKYFNQVPSMFPRNADGSVALL